jgi:ankyrin repeat protein
MYASMHDLTDTARSLPDSGADVNARNREGNTALMCAIEHKRAGMINFFIARGSDLKAVNIHNKTALDLANVKGLFRVVNEIKFRIMEKQKKHLENHF